MRELDRETREQISQDHLFTVERMNKILLLNRDREVIGEGDNYLNPRVSEKTLIMGVPGGEFSYHEHNRIAQEAALKTGEIPAGTELPSNTPKYLADLVRKSNVD